MQNQNNDKNNITKRSNSTHYKKRNHKALWIIFFIVLAAIVFGLFKGYGAYQKAEKTFNKAYEAGDTNKLRNVSNVISQNKPLSILLLGTDTGALGRHDTGRTDTLILATVNPKKETIHLTSIPRDTKVTVPGDSQPYEKINAAYTIGGPSSAVQTVQNLLNVPIDFYAIVNMGGLEKMVNAVGGVEVNPKLTFHYGAANVVKGQKVLLNGKQALDYSRMRHDDPLGDYGRQARQREVLQKLVMKGMNISSLPRYKEILNSISGNLKTDMKFNDMLAIRERYGNATHHIKSETLQGQNAVFDGIDYEVPSDDELLKITNNIRGSLGLNTFSSLSEAQNQTDDNGNGSNNGSSSTNSNGYSSSNAYSSQNAY
ncbi:LCP family protein [Apilactobacillus xinyiensis]|uniref:LCP family protein n=1 Tax=Apilactobacillus xinyiensis TaxID=2841032 RepID=UPI00203582B9|nr:LCP family protein [Apilactobacillus xinyiensis]